jgi:hypothetical protein
MNEGDSRIRRDPKRSVTPPDDKPLAGASNNIPQAAERAKREHEKQTEDSTREAAPNAKEKPMSQRTDPPDDFPSKPVRNMSKQEAQDKMWAFLYEMLELQAEQEKEKEREAETQLLSDDCADEKPHY